MPTQARSGASSPRPMPSGPSDGRAVDPGMTLQTGSGCHHDIQMAAQATRISMTLVAPWLSDTNIESGGWPDPRHLHGLQCLLKPWTATQTKASVGPQTPDMALGSRSGSDVIMSPSVSTGYSNQLGFNSSTTHGYQNNHRCQLRPQHPVAFGGNMGHG